jgi:TATA-box binding protein (TBP) (component of TFIID and TFIIIB)
MKYSWLGKINEKKANHSTKTFHTSTKTFLLTALNSEMIYAILLKLTYDIGNEVISTIWPTRSIIINIVYMYSINLQMTLQYYALALTLKNLSYLSRKNVQWQ